MGQEILRKTPTPHTSGQVNHTKTPEALLRIESGAGSAPGLTTVVNRKCGTPGSTVSDHIPYTTTPHAYHAQTFPLNPAPFLEPLTRHVPAPAPNPVLVLDVGCGSGRDLLWLKP